MNPEQLPASNVVSVNWWRYLRRTVQAAVALLMMSVAHPVIAQETGAPTESDSWVSPPPVSRRGFAKSNGTGRTSAD